MQIVLKNISKKYLLTGGRPILIKDLFFSPKVKSIWALRRVSLKIKKGVSIGVIGENGSGKSTLLKTLAGITSPTIGTVKVEGSVGSIIELGAGFHPDLTGRENIYLGGALLGFSKAQLENKYPRILKFSGLEEFIEQPIRTYSSGMVVRLAFSIAIMLDPEILLIDEVLAVGDEAFQKKCIVAIQNFKKRGGTLLFVSHDLSLVYHVCELCIWMDKGKVRSFGETSKVIGLYSKSVLKSKLPPGLRKSRWGTGEAEIVSAFLKKGGAKKTGVIYEGEAMAIVVRVKFNQKIDDPVFGITIKNGEGENIFQTNTIWKNLKTGSYNQGSLKKVEYQFEESFPEGRYFVSPAVAESELKKYYDWREAFLVFDVIRKNVSGTIAPAHTILI